MLKTDAFFTRPTPARQDAPFHGFVLSRMSPCDVPLRVRLSLHAPCGLAWDKARPWAKRLSWQTQGGRVM